MKVIRTNNQLKIVGKAWEVRGKLRELSQSPISLKDYLYGQRPNMQHMQQNRRKLDLVQ
ncbi:Z-ring formation inhibitor MciZ [Vulcanibacillus modesticaldus]|uniref:Z-ring formation inhibitor MciZ n=1 Tax=Vulcanibacillus modesticaldus TaxID=337097 RepID=UPI0009FCF3C1